MTELHTDQVSHLRLLEERLQRLEDESAILRLIASYGPSADSGSGDVAEKLFTEEAEYDIQVGTLNGGAAVGDMIDHLPLHRQLLAGGCAHTTDLPLIEVDGDRAWALCHGFVLRREGDQFVVWRAAAVWWEFQRATGRWRISRRVNRLLDGQSVAPDLFRKGLLECWS
jgi:hypothetical protein